MSSNFAPTCPVCKVNPCLWTKRSGGYVEWCSPTCRSRHPAVEAKRRSTCLSKYGDVTSARSKDVKLKKAKTCVERYGHVSPTLNVNVREKQKNTMKERYGGDTPSQAPAIVEKIKNTLYQKYGTSNFGEVKHLHDSLYDTSQRTRVNNWLPARWEGFKDMSIPLYSIEEFTTVGRKMPYQCTRCGGEFTSSLINGRDPRCPACFPFNRINWKQQDVVKFVSSLGVSVEEGCRSIIPPKELDLVALTHGIAIEFNGLYWHSEGGSGGRVDRHYHLGKTMQCSEKGVQLLHVFEDEWDNKKDIVKSIISSKLSMSHRRLFARRCVVKEISSQASNKFLDANHIQGADRSSIRMGLWFNDELVMVMTFGKPRYDKKVQYELIRMATVLNTTVVGGASKLLTHFIRHYNPESIISYADRRYSRGNVYTQLGFHLSHVSPPSYFYVNLDEGCTKRYNRQRFQKHKLGQQLHNFDETKTELDNMKQHGYSRVWDCGSLVFVRKFD